MKINENLLKSIRVSNDKTQQQVADEVGINVQQYARYEKGINEPKVSIGKKIAAAIGTVTDVVASFYERDMEEENGTKQSGRLTEN